jgi:hypothetical protein
MPSNTVLSIFINNSLDARLSQIAAPSCTSLEYFMYRPPGGSRRATADAKKIEDHSALRRRKAAAKYATEMIDRRQDRKPATPFRKTFIKCRSGEWNRTTFAARWKFPTDWDPVAPGAVERRFHFALRQSRFMSEAGIQRGGAR